ncbi:MAG TPA: hypothetical protein VL500_00595 [Candidatus Eisenbacteria bacterium]|nr:hypothetical protein [Candidatus Eisenbacteria bacterium]
MAQPSIAMYRRIATGFLVLTALMIALVAYVVLARATVIVLSEQEKAQADFVIDVAEKPTQGEVPGLVFEQADSLSQAFPATSVVKVDAPAEGRVKIGSSLFRAQTLVATTRLLTPDGVLFRIKKTITVPAGGSVEVDAFADVPGATGNVGNVSFTIPGLNPDAQRHFTAVTVTPMDGGVKEVRMVTQTDVDAAASVLEEKLKGSLAATLRSRGEENGLVKAGEIIEYETTKKLTDVPVGTEQALFTLTLSMKATGVLYDASRFADQIRAKLKDKLPHDRSLLSVEDESVTKDVEKTDLVAGRANVRVTASGTTVLSPDAPALAREKLVGVSVDAAKAYLDGIDGVASASVKVSPIWTGRMPNVADHITVEVR